MFNLKLKINYSKWLMIIPYFPNADFYITKSDHF